MSDRPLRVLCWEGYERPEITQRFAARHRISVRGDTLISDAHAAALVRADPARYDILNINNAYIAKDLHPAGCVQTLDGARFDAEQATWLGAFERLYRWCFSTDGKERIGICQRFGAFNLVVNTDLVSRQRAQDEGFALAADPELGFGILHYEDFNLFHIAIGAGINPFNALTEAQFQQFERVARDWVGRATLLSDDHHALNQALVDKRIAFYISGGVYTASPVRLAGQWQIEAITPRSGPINGRGGIVFTEITSAVADPGAHPLAVDFLGYLLEPESAIAIAFIEGTCNPVAQMGDARVMRAFTKDQLKAIQWDTLEEDVSYCADYDQVPDHGRLLGLLQAIVSERSSNRARL